MICDLGIDHYLALRFHKLKVLTPRQGRSKSDVGAFSVEHRTPSPHVDVGCSFSKILLEIWVDVTGFEQHTYTTTHSVQQTQKR